MLRVSFYTLSYQNGQIISSQAPLVEFYKHPRIQWNLNEMGHINVSVNSHSLTYSSSGHCCVPSGSVDLNVDTWSITGDSIPSFPYTDKNPFPGCSNFFSSPDSISKSSGCTFTIANVTNMNAGTIIITESVLGKYPHTYSLSLTPGSNIITLSASQLSDWTIGTTGYVFINMNNSSIVNACDRNYWFMKSTSTEKSFKIVP